MITLRWCEIPVSYTYDLIKLCLQLVNKRSIVEGNRPLIQVGFKIKCSNLFISEKSLIFFFSGIILKSSISVMFLYLVEKKLLSIVQMKQKIFAIKDGGMYNPIKIIFTLSKIISNVRNSKFSLEFLMT